MSVIDDYLATRKEPERSTIERMYTIIREMVPAAAEEISYGMPAFKYKNYGLMAVMVTKHGLSLYPFCAIKRLGVDLSEFETTTGSIHFTAEHPLPDDLLRNIISARLRQIG
jgi:uncharacterized protein YdhG (YjbR/CyaY superfamily)